MNKTAEAFAGGFRAEVVQLGRARLFLALTVVQAITFLLLVSLFGLTGSRAPVAVVSADNGAYANTFVTILASIHHSFALHRMSQDEATEALHRGELVAILTLPKNFSETIAQGKDAVVDLVVDNIDTDMTDDVQRALPAAIVTFGRRLNLPGIHVHVAESDLLPHDTGFIPYLVVSGLVLDAFLIAGILSAMTVAREFESGTVKALVVAPAPPIVPLAGRILATTVIAAISLMAPLLVVVLGFHVTPLHPLAALGGLLLCTTIFSTVGAALGAILKRTLPVVSLILSLSLPLYICSGSLEPARFDGDRIWLIAHFSPVYYGVGVLESAFHGFQVTPEFVFVDGLALLGWAILTVTITSVFLRKQLS